MQRTIVVLGFLSWIGSIVLVWNIASDFRQFKICQYAESKTKTDTTQDVVVSQRTEWRNLEKAECDGKIRIYRDKELETQNFTIIFPEHKYVVSTRSASGVLNVIFHKSTDSIPTEGKPVGVLNLSQ